jgi:hypothetical protein
MFDLNLQCSWDNCPGHFRTQVKGDGTIVLTWAMKVYYFYATDCLAFWAANFPVGHVLVGKASDEQ